VRPIEPEPGDAVAQLVGDVAVRSHRHRNFSLAFTAVDRRRP
jgi:hypothetical protein